MKNICKTALQNIWHYLTQFTIGVLFIGWGLYGLNHINYLDDARITDPPLPPGFEQSTSGFVDDRWFVILLIIIGFFIIFAVMLGDRYHRGILIDVSLIPVAVIETLVAVAFGERAFDVYFNQTWVFALISLVFTLRIIANRGKGRDYR